MQLSIRPIWRRMRGATPFGADTALTVGANALVGLEGAASGVIAARLLGPTGRGELAAIQNFPGFMATLAMLGMIEAAVYYCAKEPLTAGRHIGSGVTLALIGSIPIAAAAYLLMPLALAAQTAVVVATARFYLLMVLVYAVVALPAHALRGRGDFVAWNGIRVVPNLMWIIVLIGAWSAGLRDVRTLALGYLASQAILFFPVALIVARRIEGPFGPMPREWGGMLRYGLPCTMTNLPQTLNLRVDQMAMAMMLPAHDLGLYAVAVAWSGTTAPLLGALGATLMPSIAAQAERENAAEIFSRGVRLASLIAAGACVVLLALTPLGVAVLFGESYRAAIPAARVLIPAGTILGLNSVLEEGLRGLGHPYSVLWAELVGLVTTGIGLALTLRPLGLMGAALSSLAGYSTVCAVLLYGAHRLVGTTPAALLRPRSAEIVLGVDRVRSLLCAIATAAE